MAYQDGRVTSSTAQRDTRQLSESADPSLPHCSISEVFHLYSGFLACDTATSCLHGPKTIPCRQIGTRVCKQHECCGTGSKHGLANSSTAPILSMCLQPILWLEGSLRGDGG
jgi:hypothetical protein